VTTFGDDARVSDSLKTNSIVLSENGDDSMNMQPWTPTRHDQMHAGTSKIKENTKRC